ncbi:MAG: tetratricopeptide repeat protein [Chloroflexota bacterium]
MQNSENGTNVYNRITRIGVTLIAIFTLYVMGSHLWREVASYHYLILGNAQRDRALSMSDLDDQTASVKTAVSSYTRAMAIAETPILGMRSSDGLRVPIGIPLPIHTTWLASLNSRAAMESQLGLYAAAVYDYTTVLAYTDRPEVLVNRAIAYQGLGTETDGPMGEMDIERDDYQRAIADFNQAIDDASEQARYLLWRGVAYHALNRITLADADYVAALAMEGDGALTPTQRAQAYTGRGWIAYARKDYETAVEYFQAAVDAVTIGEDESSAADPPQNEASTEALLGLGYAYYSLRQYDAALDAWNLAADTNAQLPQPDPGVYVSLGTLYWRVGTLGDNYDARGSNQCVQSTLSTADKEATAVELQSSIDNFEAATAVGGQSDDELAFTYRTLGQVYFLLASCPGYDEAETLLKAVDSYSQAIELTPDNALYWHMRGRLSYAAWQVLPADSGIAARELLLQALGDQEQALALDPVQQGDYRPQVWYDRTYGPAVNGTLARAAELEAAGDAAEAAAYYSLVADYAADVPLLLYGQALTAAKAGDWETAVSLYHEATLVAARKEDLGGVKTAAFALRDYVLAQPRLDVLTAYWPLLGDERAWETAVSQLERPDLYWRYRAEFGFRFTLELFKQRPGDEASYETIYKQIIADIERAYQLNPEAHQTWRDFFVDGNLGWLYLRRADDYYAAADYAQALADYSEAAARIQPDSDNARSDLADALFRAGLTALQLQNYRAAVRWYGEGLTLAQRYNLDDKISDAAAALETLLENNPELAPNGRAILQDLGQ